MKYSGIGGQAVMEGVMMRNGNKYAVAVRTPDKSIAVDVKNTKDINDIWHKIPIIRGMVSFIDSLVIGLSTLMYSASFFEDEEDAVDKSKLSEEELKKLEKKEKAEMGGTLVLSFVLALGIFFALPYFISLGLNKYIESQALIALIEGLIRIGIFIGYIVMISHMDDIKRTFMYHGAEHKCINCIEAGKPLTVENVRTATRFHKRCGTSFIFIVFIISVFVFMFISFDNTWVKLIARLLLIPVIAGISYEFIRLAGRHENGFVNIFSKPGLWLQRLTVMEPDDDMIEVGIASVEAVFDWEGFIEENRECF
ncbi:MULTISPECIES: DUF1385 domain-containing protein [Pseudobutyrivibrio]|uniref:Uncharacterized conserved protein YqhQ n=1 Tax=Pseudobutyrivibrio ruminis TaxID=46206 RepID=A0A1H7F9D7_9FIRM|nr:MULTISPECIES: DUF1385 domain-containing protein [Pseudobutyrivibrio]SEK22588.1 Uncharacterized conserved protein YqhQ [Pseudobutyrivibrio ruminis]SES97162.1 Uncharacterized conserved protein YqhQ [Pseudobutyrivibrio sp. C4]